jgi:hypothetical protein
MQRFVLCASLEQRRQEPKFSSCLVSCCYRISILIVFLQPEKACQSFSTVFVLFRTQMKDGLTVVRRLIPRASAAQHRQNRHNVMLIILFGPIGRGVVITAGGGKHENNTPQNL